MKFENCMPIMVPAMGVWPRKCPIALPSDHKNVQPFFIIGSGRNGSTLLASLLAQHTQLGVVPEQFALGYAAIKFRLRPFAGWPRQVKEALSTFSNPELSHWDYDFKNCEGELLALEKDQRSFRVIVEYLYRNYLGRHQMNSEIWGDKSPKNTLMLKYFFPAFSKARYIFLVRDGRDVVRSYVQGGEQNFGEYGQINRAIERWNDSIEKWAWLKQRTTPDQRLEIKYEDLVTNPKQELSAITRFLGIEFEESMLSVGDTDPMRVEGQEVHRNVGSGFMPEQVGLWRRFFNEEQMQQLNNKMSAGLKQWGYQ